MMKSKNDNELNNIELDEKSEVELNEENKELIESASDEESESIDENDMESQKRKTKIDQSGIYELLKRIDLKEMEFNNKAQGPEKAKYMDAAQAACEFSKFMTSLCKGYIDLKISQKNFERSVQFIRGDLDNQKEILKKFKSKFTKSEIQELNKVRSSIKLLKEHRGYKQDTFDILTCCIPKVLDLPFFKRPTDAGTKVDAVLDTLKIKKK